MLVLKCKLYRTTETTHSFDLAQIRIVYISCFDIMITSKIQQDRENCVGIIFKYIFI